MLGITINAPLQHKARPEDSLGQQMLPGLREAAGAVDELFDVVEGGGVVSSRPCLPPAVVPEMPRLGCRCICCHHYPVSDV